MSNQRVCRGAWVTLFFFCLLLVLVPSSFAASKDSEKLFGTWENKDYDYQYIWNADLTAELYIRVPSHHFMAIRYVIEKKWNDAGGNSWYHIKGKWSSFPYDEKNMTVWYTLAKVDAAGKILELDASTKDYPRSLDKETLHLRYHKLYYRKAEL